MGAKFTLDAFKRAVGKHGFGKIVRRIGAKLGWRAVAKLGLKGGLAAAGTGLSGGTLGVLMAAWTISDLYQVMEIIAEMD